MKRRLRWAGLLLAFGLAGLYFWSALHPEAVKDEKQPPLLFVKDPPPEERPWVSSPEPQDDLIRPISSVDLPLATALPAPTPAPEGRYSITELMEVLPLWMKEEADLDTFATERLIAGTQVTQVRGRYAWPNGSRMEVEISDVGAAPSKILLKSLGFNPDRIDHVTDAGFEIHTGTTAEPGYFEYNYEDWEGGLQVLVADRFLVEVKLLQLPEESFDVVFQYEIPISVLEEMGAKE
jgi:hypothetical protein